MHQIGDPACTTGQNNINSPLSETFRRIRKKVVQFNNSHGFSLDESVHFLALCALMYDDWVQQLRSIEETKKARMATIKGHLCAGMGFVVKT